MKSSNFCIILAGGKGRRLWPCSRETYPKQFMDFFGVGRTQLQQAFDRFRNIIPCENIYVSTNIDYAHFVREQLPELPVENILAEPIHRNTAPSVSWGCMRIAKRCDDARVIIAPSDQAVMREEAYDSNVLKGLEFVGSHDALLVLGVKPSRPEPGYGYIQIGESLETDNMYKVRSFTEKPEREFARVFMESGEFLWNTGTFLSGVGHLISCLSKLLPPVMRHIQDKDLSQESEMAYVREHFPRYPNISIDHGLLEKSDDVYVMECDFGWADLGTWHSIYEAVSRTDNENVAVDCNVLAEDSKNNIIKVPKDHLAIINGLDGYIVAEKDNVLLICRKEDSSALIRKYVNEVQMKYGENYV